MSFFESPNPTEFESRENAEILVNSIESGLFGHSNMLNSAVFQDGDLKFFTHIHQ